MDSSPFRIIVGLGNPGEQYACNRHNAGFLVVKALASEAGSTSWSTECLARTCRMNLEGWPLILARPLTYMNGSGEAVRLLCAKYEFAPQDILVVLDDLNLPFGRLRIRARGSAGGHRGLESILQALGSDEVLRLRLGIGEEQMPEEKAVFVLSDFPAGKRAEVNEMIARACDAVKTLLRNGLPATMAVFNA